MILGSKSMIRSAGVAWSPCNTSPSRGNIETLVVFSLIFFEHPSKHSTNGKDFSFFPVFRFFFFIFIFLHHLLIKIFLLFFAFSFFSVCNFFFCECLPLPFKILTILNLSFLSITLVSFVRLSCCEFSFFV